MSIQLMKEFEPIFYPKSIAVVGASRNEAKSGTKYFKSLLETKFKGEVYPVNGGAESILGHKAYPSLSAIPGPVDYVIVAIPKRYLPELLDDIEKKGVKAVQFFTAGFRESGEQQGIEMEADLVKRARSAGFHVIGPNCIGVYNPSINMPYGMSPRLGEPGSVGFISQSGGVAGKIVKAGYIRGINFSKLVSFGNGSELDSVDYLEYFKEDPETEIIGAYLEGVTDGRKLIKLFKEISPVKPVVLWKGGRTEAGASAAQSHTGSMAASHAVWTALARQLGIVMVEDLEEMADALLTIQHVRKPLGQKLSIISGIAGGGGGDSVAATDGSSALGLEVIPFSGETRRQLKQILPSAGSILRNPLDVGSIGANLPVWENVLELVSADKNVDLIIIQQAIDDLFVNLGKENLEALNDVFIRFAQHQKTPLLMVSPPPFIVEARAEIEQKLRRARIPIFSSLKNAANAIVNVNQYYRVHPR